MRCACQYCRSLRVQALLCRHFHLATVPGAALLYLQGSSPYQEPFDAPEAVLSVGPWPTAVARDERFHSVSTSSVTAVSGHNKQWTALDHPAQVKP